VTGLWESSNIGPWIDEDGNLWLWCDDSYYDMQLSEEQRQDLRRLCDAYKTQDRSKSVDGEDETEVPGV